MISNVDVVAPIQLAVYSRLTSDPVLMGKITGVWDLRAPEGTQWPYITISGLSSSPMGALDRFGARTVITLHVWSVVPGNGEIAGIGSDLLRLLDHQTLHVEGHHTVAVRLEQYLTVNDADPDIRHLVARFSIETEAD
jgi:hypothetical protein